MIKLVASDLDGTIIDKAGSIYENNFKAINDLNQKNIDFVICTGKTYPIVKGMCSKFNASSVSYTHLTLPTILLV